MKKKHNGDKIFNILNKYLPHIHIKEPKGGVTSHIFFNITDTYKTFITV